MLHRTPARWLFALVAVFGFYWTAPAADPVKPPNIVFIVADDLGCFELGCYGQKLIHTPNIDKLAAGGMKFTQFYAGNNVCAPSRCCLMTGKHAGHAAIRDNKQFKKVGEGQQPLPASETTVATLLKGKGYATGAMGKWGLGMWDTTGSPLKHGFDLFYGYNCQAHAHSHYPIYLYRNAEKFTLPGNNGKTGDTFTQDLFEQEAVKFLDAHKDGPFFLFLPFIVPHVAVQVPEDALAEYQGKLGADPAYDGKKGYLPHPAPHAGYAAMVTRMDRSVGRIMDKLKELKLDDNTLVVFTSDNGPTHNVGGADSTFFQSAGTLRGLKGSMYEGGIRIPLIASWPGHIKPGSTSAMPSYFPDVLPTLCELVGATTPPGLDGVSMLPTLTGKGEQKDHTCLYWESPGYGGQQAVREKDWKAVRQNLGKGTIKTELYDLATDPSETTDVGEKHPDVLTRLEGLMKTQHTPSAEFPLQTIDAKRK
ncbi:arylsulfatase [Fimbriiglobus ruber]|uniref:Choline-sulfatase n=1 Tax=Fimbriiglobus ruber TaxID=1908690 RepID=A0A225DI43_9BACT|nr:arylsulfatase [Fimbriiglobus ruber]OWK36045.1 Choline-sulfatase [Fimbriiglobus ruber]